MVGASPVALRHPPPRLRLPPRRLSSLSPSPSSYRPLALPTLASSTASRVLSVTVRAEARESGDAQRSLEEPSTAAGTETPPPRTKTAANVAAAGFGGSVAETKGKKGKQKGSVIRRAPVQKTSSVYSSVGGSGAEQREKTVNESAFLLTWLGLGLLILVEGVALAASGFLPEEWDGFFVKYLYPSFTPTVFLFVCGTVAYGVFKYLQGEKQGS